MKEKKLENDKNNRIFTKEEYKRMREELQEMSAQVEVMIEKVDEMVKRTKKGR